MKTYSFEIPIFDYDVKLTQIEDFETAGYLAGFLAVEFNKFHNQI